MKSFMIKGIASLLALLALPIALVLIGFLTPSQYGDTFLGALEIKYERLYEIDEPKVVLIGGSSVAFGYDTKLMEEHLGMPVVNFGLYATLGTKVMLDLSRDAIGEGDIIVLAPETDPQTLSLYFNGESFWQAADSDFSMLSGVASDNVDSLVGSYWRYLSQKLFFLQEGTPNPDGVYNRASFDEYGDIVYERPYNTMLFTYDPGLTVTLDSSIVSPDFIDYVNEYTAMAKSKGATVYFSFPPINERSLDPETDEDSLFAYFDFLSRELDCEIITNISDCILEAGYFYDSNFHLNDSGVVVRTATMIKDLFRALGLNRSLTLELPAAPDIPVADFSNPSDPSLSTYADCFTYEEYNGALIINGVTEKGKNESIMMLPAYYDGKPVVAIGEYAFKDCTALRELTVNGNIRQIANRAFAGCDTLTRVNLLGEAQNVEVSTEGLLDDTSPKLRFYVPLSIYSSYTQAYFWQNYGTRIEVE